jgi:5-formyltetrahydrofolate cyclo-ligase
LRSIKTRIRQHILAKRRQLSLHQKTLFSHRITKTLVRQPYYKSAQSIAFYYSFPDEVSTFELINHALQQQKSCYLPIVARPKLKFAKIGATTPMKLNRFGIFEPEINQPTIDPRQLDLVIVPLVAFNHHCDRLGMGGGYYDMTFAFKKHCNNPRLVGIAFEIQRVNNLLRGKLDLKLDEVITEQRSYNPGTIIQ